MHLTWFVYLVHRHRKNSFFSLKQLHFFFILASVALDLDTVGTQDKIIYGL